MEQIFFKTAEFAALCGVKKDTLLHYDHIGLLKPERVGENGYRYYSVRQLAAFDLIDALRRLGTPLAEIRDYLTHRSPQGLLNLLREKEQEIAQERKRLERMEALLHSAAAGVEIAQQVRPGEIRIETRPAALCAVVEAPAFSQFEEPAYLLSIRELLTFARQQGSSSLAPGDIIRRESLEGGRFLEDFYYCQVPEETQGWRLHHRPEGRYAVLYHQGPYETQQAACRTLWHWVKENGYTPDGDLYEEDLVSYASSSDPNRYLLRLSLKIL